MPSTLFPGDAVRVYKEARKHRRVELKVRCWCTGGGTTLYVNILNASLGGLFVRTYTPFSPGDRISVLWKFPGGSSAHKVTAQVVWRRENGRHRVEQGTPLPPGMGLKFLDLPEPAKSELEKLGDAKP